ncbi:MAG: sigma-70 family RNA polymerase sigma factor [Oscillospiraceae bacterium]|nr:sigma-70 family RNA polymerase sigma factor [Oscillospiraceae bacterium]
MFTTLIQLAFQNLAYLALHLEGGSTFPPKLSKEEENECIAKIIEGDTSARNKLIEHNLRLVAYIVNKHYYSHKDTDDLISIGSIGLIRAVETFSSDKNVNFSTYAGKCIDNQIKMYFRKIKNQQKELPLNGTATPDKEGNQISLIDFFQDPVNIEDVTELRADLKMLYKYINEVLNPRERQIICKRYGLLYNNGGKPKVEKPLTQHEVAKCLGISRSYVSRIEKKALEKLREKFTHR